MLPASKDSMNNIESVSFSSSILWQHPAGKLEITLCLAILH